MSQSSSSKESSSFEGSSEDPTSTEREQFEVEEEENSTSSSKYESQSDIEAPPPMMQSSFDITSDQITTANSITPIALDKSLTSDAAILNDSSILHNPPVAMQRDKSRKDVFLNNFFGVNIKPRVDVPAGYTVQFAGHSKVPFLIKDAVSKAVLESEAADEHLRPAVKLKSCTSLERIRKVYGEGVYLYFDFILFVGIANLILFALACVNVIAHFVIDGWNSDLPLTHLIENFYVSSYSPDVYQYWWWSTIISGASWYAFGPALGRRITVMFKRFGYFDHQDRYRLKSMDIIKDKKGRPKSRPTTSRCRLVLSYILFVIMLLISAIITMGFIVAQESLGQALTAFLVSAFLFVVNLGWKKMCYFLTLLEAHYTWSKFKFHHVLKFYMWRVLSVSVVFLTRFLVRRGYLVDVPLFSWIPNSNSQTNTCGLSALGDQFLYIMIISVFGAELIDLIYNKLYFCFCSMRKQTGKALENGRPEFDIAEQYMELLYRQYVTYLGIPIFPFITVFAFVGAFIDYLVYKYLLLRVCRTPPRLRGSMKNLLVFSSFITATLAIAIWPFGVGWTLAGYDLKERCPGSVFDNSW